MSKKHNKYHLEIHKYKGNYSGILRTSFREDGKVKHATAGRLSYCDLDVLRQVQAALQGNTVMRGEDGAMQVVNSKEYGASYAAIQLAKELKLDVAIYSKNKIQWVKDCIAMICGRLIYAGSKLGLSRRVKDSAIWELSGVEGGCNVNKHCYSPMDNLLKRQKAIQKTLAKSNLENKSLVLYDITSSYLEGDYKNSDLANFGYNRDKKRGYEQIVIGLICNKDGCPVSIEVFEGNTKDSNTTIPKINEIKTEYGVKEIVFVGDRGMITRYNADEIRGIEGVKTVSALTHPQIRNLLNDKTIQLDLFDDLQICEVSDVKNPQIRYCLCKNKSVALRETETRNQIIDKIKTGLDKLSNLKATRSDDKLGINVGKIFAKTSFQKYFKIEIKNGRLTYELNHELIKADESIDGCYIITTDVSKEIMNKDEVVETYKRLQFVESAFRSIKTTRLEVRPINHKTDDRIKSHVFICMLSYYLMWHMKKRLEPLLNEENVKAEKKWTFDLIIERLKSIRKQTVIIKNKEIKIISTPDEEQKMILKLLGIKL